jgi:hypothetical protein
MYDWKTAFLLTIKGEELDFIKTKIAFSFSTVYSRPNYAITYFNDLNFTHTLLHSPCLLAKAHLMLGIISSCAT